MIKSIVAHTDAVSSLCIGRQGVLFSGGHDGALRGWDLRNYNCCFDIVAHRRKYDEGVMALGGHDKYPILASGKYLQIIMIRWSRFFNQNFARTMRLRLNSLINN